MTIILQKIIPVKPLIKPITVIIDINICSYWDKTNGNNYCSGQAVINNDTDNTIYYPMQYNQTNQAKTEILDLVAAYFIDIDIQKPYYTSDTLAKGILINTNVHYGNMKECKLFGLERVL